MSPLAHLLEPFRREGTPRIMGVINVTPDSFSDGSAFLEAGSAVGRVDALLDAGADLIDLGAESTRPGSTPVSASVQIERLGPALAYAARRGALVSVDTTCAEVARYALANGASLINDVSCLADDGLARAVASEHASLVIMHARGPMGRMAGFSEVPEDAYRDVVADVRSEWLSAKRRALAAGVADSDIFFDPGLGFMKSALHSLELVRRLHEFEGCGAGIVVGPSRKSFLAYATRAGSDEPLASPLARLGATIAACLACAARGAAILRVHDVFEVRQALRAFRAMSPGRPGEVRRDA